MEVETRRIIQVCESVDKVKLQLDEISRFLDQVSCNVKKAQSHARPWLVMWNNVSKERNAVMMKQTVLAKKRKSDEVLCSQSGEENVSRKVRRKTLKVTASRRR
mmetsp:Transcript_6937/g.10981  ORF Transcript_6937/g.10981 Transcript_6937/m.10981 type:complete len:104 (+) Transcript_6937:1-312(+)